MDPDRERIYVGGHSRRANGLGPRQIGLRGTHRLGGGCKLVRAQQRVVIGANDACDHFHLRAPPVFAGDVLGQFGGTNGVLGLAGAVEYLVRRELRLKVVEEIRDWFNGPIWKFCAPNWCWVSSELNTKTGLSLRVQDSE